MPESRSRIIDLLLASSARDHLLFVAIFLVGAILTVALRLGTGLHIFVVLLAPLGLMAFYMFLVGTNRHRLRKDQAADNVYYLGFLFTITTLGTALIRYQISDEPNVAQIIGDLGIGLSTTVVGLLGRIVLGQFGQMPEDFEGRARADLAQASENVRRQIIGMGEDISRIQAATLQIVQESNERMEKTSGDAVASARQIEKNIAAISVPEDILASKFAPAFNRLTEAVDTVASRFERLSIDPKMLDDRIDKTLEPLRGSILAISGVIRQADSSIASLITRGRDMADIGMAAERMVRNQELMIRWFDEMAANQERLAAINSSLEKSAQAIDLMHPALNRLREDITGSHKRYRESISAAASAADETRKRIEEMGGAIRQLGDEFTTAMAKLAENANRTSGD